MPETQRIQKGGSPRHSTVRLDQAIDDKNHQSSSGENCSRCTRFSFPRQSRCARTVRFGNLCSRRSVYLCPRPQCRPPLNKFHIPNLTESPRLRGLSFLTAAGADMGSGRGVWERSSRGIRAGKGACFTYYLGAERRRAPGRAGFRVVGFCSPRQKGCRSVATPRRTINPQ